MSDEYDAGFKAGYDFCKMLSEVSEYKGAFWPDKKKYGTGTYRNAFAEGTITGSREFKVSWKWIDDGEGTTSHIEKINA
jgi:hypothetical protein